MQFDREYRPRRYNDPWYSRGYLKRNDSAGTVQSNTFRLIDAVPAYKVQEWKQELSITPDSPMHDSSRVELHRRISVYEDLGRGECWLGQPELATTVEKALLYFDGERYDVLAWCIMPNHVHVMYLPYDERTLGKLSHSWKSFTAQMINKIIGRRGEFWEREGYDRYIRNDTHYNNVLAYIENNPVKAGLVKQADLWMFSSARLR